jgi:plastocyanin
MTRQYLRFVVMAVTVAAGMGAVALALTAERPEPREIEIVVRDMSFYVNGGARPNPVIRLAPGEPIVVTVRNEDTGIIHDFSIPAWSVATKRLRVGESQRLVVTVPDAPGAVTYECSPHAKMMNGTISVE